MDKCREEFEKQKYWIGLFRDAVDFDEELGRYVLNGQRKLYAFHLDSFNEKWAIWQEAWQHQQAKVEELQRRNQMLNDNIKEQGQKLVYQNEVIETQAEKLLGLRDEKAELQKRVDAALKLIESWNEIAFDKTTHWTEGYEEGCYHCAAQLEQALKGEGL
ncbi:hypothetical protein [Acinetobacter pittii]|uniref:hypothetical protein n=1 Tax=Acinetobacter pittii TaxID=48296 RepID=UPI001022FB80|nr:hypothetical protein [Acinetobacter pittii]MDR9713518.1 hypothetical protein [Acinetobacter pittii]RZH36898.1 hypothetical protein EXD92_01810 [Acinetobacter pittii]